MDRVKPRTLSGFMELLPEKQIQMERIMESLRETYALYGFAPLDTPAIEAAEVLLAKGGGETEKQIYHVMNSGGNPENALRFDLTVPLAKYVAINYGQLAFPFRRYQIGKVYRGERAQRGRFREFYQADIDIIGDGQLDIMNEAEIPAIIYRTFTGLGLTKFKIRVNNRKVLGGFFAILGVSGKSGVIMRTIDKLDKIGSDKCKSILLDEGLSEEQTRDIIDFISVSGDSGQKLTALGKYCGKNELFDAGLSELRAVASFLPQFGVPEENFEIDLTIARGLDYYTGTVYETTLTEYPEIGSVCSGGRYDDLAEYYTDKKLPGVGISIGLTRLFYVLEEQGQLSDELICSPCDALVIPMTEDLSAAVSAATLLRERGIRTQLYSENKKFKAKMNYADKIKVPFVVLIGEDEIAAGVLAVKDMVSGEQVLLKPEAAAQHIQSGVAGRLTGKIICDR